MKAIITDYQYENVNQEKSLIEGAGYMLVAHTTSTPEEIIAAASDADAVITQYCNIDERIISRLQHCRVIIKYGIGINNIDVRRCFQTRNLCLQCTRLWGGRSFQSCNFTFTLH